MSLFDLVSDEEKKEYEIRMPDVEEYDKEMILAFEKDVLGIYLSGHPLERYRNIMEKMISAKTTDFQPDEESGVPKVYDGQKVIIGGMITEKTIKYTRNNKVMAFLTVEDLLGTVEIVGFPRDYEKWQAMLNEMCIRDRDWKDQGQARSDVRWYRELRRRNCHGKVLFGGHRSGNRRYSTD